MEQERKMRLTQKTSRRAAARAMGMLRKWYNVCPTDKVEISITVSPGCRKPSVAKDNLPVAAPTVSSGDEPNNTAPSTSSNSVKSVELCPIKLGGLTLQPVKTAMYCGLVRYIRSKWNFLDSRLGNKDRNMLDRTLTMLNPSFVSPRFSNDRAPAKKAESFSVQKPVKKVLEPCTSRVPVQLPSVEQSPHSDYVKAGIDRLVNSAKLISRNVCNHLDLKQNSSDLDFRIVSIFSSINFLKHKVCDVSINDCERVYNHFSSFKSQYSRVEFKEEERITAAMNIISDVPVLAACWLIWRVGEFPAYIHLVKNVVPKCSEGTESFRSRLGTVNIDRIKNRISKLPFSLDDQMTLIETKREIRGTYLQYAPGTLADKAVILGKANKVSHYSQGGVSRWFA